MNKFLYWQLGGGGKRLRFKYLVSLTPPVSWYLAITKHFNDKKLLKLRESYIPKLSEIVTPHTSIISSNCFAGRIMQDLGMQYNTLLSACISLLMITLSS